MPDVTPSISRRELARYIDHTLLKPEATSAQIDRLCAEAQQYQFMAVCVNPVWVERCAAALRGTTTRVATVAGFPLGATLPEVKAYEAQQAVARGAQEVDMVINLGALKDKNYTRVKEDIAAIVRVTQAGGGLTKVIIETALLTDEEKVTACQLAREARAEFVKTSTGFAASGATVSDVALMRQTVGPDMGVKAAGGVKTYALALSLIAAGANRLGASASVSILHEAESA